MLSTEVKKSNIAIFSKGLLRSTRMIPAFLVLAVFCSACSRGLTRSDAAEKLSRSDLFSKTVTFEYTKYLAYRRGANSAGDFFRALNYLGYTDEKGGLTEKGISEKKNWIPSSMSEDYEVPLATRELLEITGIGELQGETGAFVEVQYTWKWSPVNEVGTLMKLDEKTNAGSAAFRRFDDGWRLDSVKSSDAYFSYPVICREEEKKLRCTAGMSY
jgi:hypothetical protein